MNNWIESLEGRRLLTSVPTGFTDTVIASGITDTTAMDFAPDGRLFVLQQTGQVRVIDRGTLEPTPFVTLDVDSTVERGLLGIAFDPNFATNHYVYLYHTVPAPDLHNQISRFTADGDVAAPGSETDIFDLDPLNPAAGNHNGGAIHFGPDGKLYVGVGDNANGANSQSLDTTLGKILRINPDGSIPTDNPFYSTTTGNNRAIWALGVRNPFTFAFNPVTGRMFIDDVGQSTWEEIDDGIAGSNYGWPTTEGPTNDPRFRSPLFAYEHGVPSSEGGIAITGGSFYQPPVATFPAQFVGGYFFSDLGGGWVHFFNAKNGAESDFASGFDEPVDLKVDGEGNLFVLDHGDGTVHEISFPAAPIAPVIQLPKAGQLYNGGSTLIFRASAAKSIKAKSFSWTIDFFRNGIDTGVVKHLRGRKSGGLFVRRANAVAGDFYEINLTITDTAGNTTTVTRNMLPRRKT
jgi:glucose/arabinose dehydrogenase